MGFVYLILQIDIDGNELFKIGVTKNDPSKRKKTLQTGNPNEIRVLSIYETTNYHKVEKWMHRKYFDSKTGADNEWFSLKNEEVMSFIADCKKSDETITFMLKTNQFYK